MNINPSSNSTPANNNAITSNFDNKTTKKSRTELVSQLRNQVQSGQYKPNLENLASKMISSGALK